VCYVFRLLRLFGVVLCRVRALMSVGRPRGAFSRSTVSCFAWTAAAVCQHSRPRCALEAHENAHTHTQHTHTHACTETHAHTHRQASPHTRSVCTAPDDDPDAGNDVHSKPANNLSRTALTQLLSLSLCLSVCIGQSPSLWSLCLSHPPPPPPLSLCTQTGTSSTLTLDPLTALLAVFSAAHEAECVD
jgi:hypothetical protein